MTREWHPQALAQVSLRSCQFLFACISAALYAVDLGKWFSAGIHADPNWIYAEVVSVLSAASCIAQWWLALHPAVSAPWDCVLALLWLVTVAIFGQELSAHDEHEGGFSSERIGAAAVIDGLSMLLWLASAVEVCLCCGMVRRAKKQQMKEVTEEAGSFVAEKVNVPEGNPPAYDEHDYDQDPAHVVQIEKNI